MTKRVNDRNVSWNWRITPVWFLVSETILQQKVSFLILGMTLFITGYPGLILCLSELKLPDSRKALHSIHKFQETITVIIAYLFSSTGVLSSPPVWSLNCRSRRSTNQCLSGGTATTSSTSTKPVGRLLLSGSFLIKFSSLSAPTKIEELSAGSHEYLCRSWKRRVFCCWSNY